MGRFAFTRMGGSDNDSIVQTIVGNTLHAVAKRAQQRFGDHVLNVDPFGQLPWVRDNPQRWFTITNRHRHNGFIITNRPTWFQHLHEIRETGDCHSARRQVGCFHGSFSTWTYQEFETQYGVDADAHWVIAKPMDATCAEGDAVISSWVCQRQDENVPLLGHTFEKEFAEMH